MEKILGYRAAGEEKDDADERIHEIVSNVAVFARSTPQQKKSVVERLRRREMNERVMFVGDGVNDLNALRSADIGIALLEPQTEEEIKKQQKEQEAKIPYPSVMQQPGNKPATIMMLADEARRRAAARGTNPNVEIQQLIREQNIYKNYLKMQKL